MMAEKKKKSKGTSLCFICELPIHQHQVWCVWRVNLLSPTGVVTSSEGPSYVNNLYHEDCLVCSTCSVRLKPTNDNAAKRYGNKIYCPLHYHDVSGTGGGGEEFMNKLRDFKRQSLGCAEARRKSSTTLSFPVPVQACPGAPNCSGYPHDIKPTAGYWIECKGGIQVEEGDSPTPVEPTRLSASPHHLRGAASSENIFMRKLERSDTSKSTSNMEPIHTLHPPTIQIMDASHKTKDDLELCRKHGPNIIITMPQAASPPPSPPAPLQIPLPIQLETDDEPQKRRAPDEPFELISFQEEMFEKHFHGKEHWYVCHELPSGHLM